MPSFYRVYANLSTSGVLSLTDAELPGVLAYNRRYRPGCAQFVDGRCVYRGYLSVKEAATIDPTVTAEIPGVTVQEAVAVLQSHESVGMPVLETETGGAKLARALERLRSLGG